MELPPQDGRSEIVDTRSPDVLCDQRGTDGSILPLSTAAPESPAPNNDLLLTITQADGQQESLVIPEAIMNELILSIRSGVYLVVNARLEDGDVAIRKRRTQNFPREKLGKTPMLLGAEMGADGCSGSVNHPAVVTLRSSGNLLKLRSGQFPTSEWPSVPHRLRH